MISCIVGKPGYGKTLYMTYLMKLGYLSDNNFINKLVYKIKYKKDMPIINNNFSNYPILLDKKRKIYTNKIGLKHCILQYRFPDNSRIAIDEIQFSIDSMRYNDISDTMANFFQAHRHIGIKNFYTDSQALARIAKKLKDNSEEFLDIVSFRNFFFLPFAWVKVRKTWTVQNAENVSSQSDLLYEEYRQFIWKNSLFKSYKTRYLKNLQKYSIDFKKVPYNSLFMDFEDIKDLFFISNKETIKLKKLNVFSEEYLDNLEDFKKDNSI